MKYSYGKEKELREIIAFLIKNSDTINNVHRLYEELYGKNDPYEIEQVAEDIDAFFKTIEDAYKINLLKFDMDTFIYKVDDNYRTDLINLLEAIESLGADDFEKLCALYLKEIVGCEAVNATQHSHDQGLDFVGYKRYVNCLTTCEQNDNLLYVIGQAKHYKSQCVEASEIRELAGAIYLLKSNDFAKEKTSWGDRVIYSNIQIDAFTPVVAYFITSNYFSKYAYILCRNAAILAVDKLSLVFALLFKRIFNGMVKEEIIKEIQKVDRIS